MWVPGRSLQGEWQFGSNFVIKAFKVLYSGPDFQHLAAMAHLSLSKETGTRVGGMEDVVPSFFPDSRKVIMYG